MFFRTVLLLLYTSAMSDSWMDSIPSHERMKLRKRLRSPEAYAALREKVKGPADLEKELRRSEALAELHFALESEPAMQDALKKQVEKDLREKGIENVVEQQKLSPELRQSLEQGKFQMTVSPHPKTHHDTVTILAEGTVAVKLPLKQSFNDQYVGQFLTM